MNLATLEPHLRHLLPAQLYATLWLDPSIANLQRTFEHLRSLQQILYGYLPRHVTEHLPQLGETRFVWEESTLLFTDLAGFTPLMEANAKQGRAGALTLLRLLNQYFTLMLDVIQKAGGIPLEFTGDALLVQFRPDARQQDALRAVRAALRMQRAMSAFERIETPQGIYSLKMRIGIHRGSFLTADIGTPFRMEHVLLGETIRQTKCAEGAGVAGRICVTQPVRQLLAGQFRFEEHTDDYNLLIDDLSDSILGKFDLFLERKRLARTLLVDKSEAGLLQTIDETLQAVEPLAAFLPASILKLLVETATQGGLTPDFPQPTLLFVNLIGLPELIDRANEAELPPLVHRFSQVFTRINAAVEARGGVLKKVTYHLTGSDIVIYFGVPNAHTDDPARAAAAALEIVQIVKAQSDFFTCQIGITQGAAFVGEVGQPTGRRELNVLGAMVNLAARLMAHATTNQILISEPVYTAIHDHFVCNPLGGIQVKGKNQTVSVYELMLGTTR